MYVIRGIASNHARWYTFSHSLLLDTNALENHDPLQRIWRAPQVTGYLPTGTEL